MAPEDRVRDEGIREPGRFRTTPLPPADVEKAIDFVLERIDGNLGHFSDRFPAPSSVGCVYPAIGNTEWTSAFWTGMLWLAYEVTGFPKYRKAAENQLGSYRERIDNRIRTDTHDLGFLYTLSCVAAYRLTGDRKARDTALRAAGLLAGRFHEKAGIIQAWGDLHDPAQRGRMIIDCCMNLPLLHWASGQTGDETHAGIAFSHARRAMEHLVREDASSYHTYYMDVETGEPRFGKTAQGLSDDSCWSRGQAWGVYGFALARLRADDEAALDMAVKMADYFLNRLPEDYVCYWDLAFTEGPEERDSSAAAIAACGLLEAARHLPSSEGKRAMFANAAGLIVKSLADGYTSREMPGSNGVLLHAVYSKPAREGVDECCIWGDYFYFEALVRLLKDWEPYW